MDTIVMYCKYICVPYLLVHAYGFSPNSQMLLCGLFNDCRT